MASASPDALKAIVEHAAAARRLLSTGAPISLADFCEATVNFKLHSWQRDHLCPILERCKTERGLRIAIHGPPRFGKSIITAQRLPAWLMGTDPTHRIVLARSNEGMAAEHGAVVRDLLQGEDYQKLFGDLGVKKDAPASRFYTSARKALQDGQPSFSAVGLQTGVVSRGIDTLICDDPYGGPQDAQSEAYNEAIWRWWSQGVSTRIDQDANVVVLFHRWFEDDFTGRLLATGKFEYVRFPAIADENTDGSDPTGRKVGEVLSPMRTIEWLYEQQASDPKTFLGQFQGKPRPDSGNQFKREWFMSWPTAPKLLHWVRYWDLAVSTKTRGDWTVGALVGIGEGLQMYIRDVVRMRGSWPEVSEMVVATTSKDSLMCQREGASYAVGMDARSTQQGFVQDLALNAMFERIPLHPDTSKGDKLERANGWMNRARVAYEVFHTGIRLILGSWDQQAFIKECMAFTGMPTDTDDQVDAISGAYQLLWSVSNGIFEEKIDPKTIPGTWANLDTITGDTDDDDEW